MKKHLYPLWMLLFLVPLLVSCSDDEEPGLSPSIPVYKEVSYNFAFSFSPDFRSMAEIQTDIVHPDGSVQTFSTEGNGSPINVTVSARPIPQQLAVKVRCSRKSSFKPPEGQEYSLLATMEYSMDVLNTHGGLLAEGLKAYGMSTLLQQTVSGSQVDALFSQLTEGDDALFPQTYVFKVYLQNGTYVLETPE